MSGHAIREAVAIKAGKPNEAVTRLKLLPDLYSDLRDAKLCKLIK
jgi:hypothetical protein